MGCSKSDEAVNTVIEGDVVQFAMQQPISRALFEADPAGALNVAWELGDKVGISATVDGRLLGANYQYAVSKIAPETGSATLGAVSTLFQFRWAEEKAHTFYGYYPYTGEQGQGVHYLTEVSLPATQPQAAAGDFSHLHPMWVMKSNPYTIQGGQGTVSMDFRGVFSIVELKLKYATQPAKDRAITRVQLNATEAPLAAPIANLTLSSDKEQEKQEPALIINDGALAVDVPLTQPCTLDEVQTQSIWLLVVPGTHAAGSIGLQLETADSYRLDMTIPEAVNFEPNKVYRKEIAIDPADFYYYRDPNAPAVTYFKPIRDIADLTDGEYIISFDFANSDVDYLMQVQPVMRNPIPMTFESAQISYFGDMGIQSIAEGYVWTLKADGDNWAISAVGADGKNYLLNGCNQAQGVAIAETLTGYYAATREYSNVWTISVADSGSWIMQSTLAPTRYLAVDLVNNHWRFPTATTASNGSFVFYKKVTE
ncbi:MAG: fimbrillin family protein [Alistipes sp.]|nr:fimbrillin family protein [Alistipes sp.]